MRNVILEQEFITFLPKSFGQPATLIASIERVKSDKVKYSRVLITKTAEKVMLISNIT